MNDLDKCMQWLLERITVEKYETDYIKFIMIDYAKKYHESEVKKLNIPDVMHSVCEHKNARYSMYDTKRLWCEDCMSFIPHTEA